MPSATFSTNSVCEGSELASRLTSPVRLPARCEKADVAQESDRVAFDLPAIAVRAWKITDCHPKEWQVADVA